MHVFGLWEETGMPEEKPIQAWWEHAQALNTKAQIQMKPRTFLPRGNHANRLPSDGIFYKRSIPQRYCIYLWSLSNFVVTSETVNECSVPLKMDLQYVTYKHELVFFHPCEKQTFSDTLTVPSYYIFTPWYSFTHSQQSLSDGRIEWAGFGGEWLCHMHRL